MSQQAQVLEEMLASVNDSSDEFRTDRPKRSPLSNDRAKCRGSAPIENKHVHHVHVHSVVSSGHYASFCRIRHHGSAVDFALSDAAAPCIGDAA